MSKKTMCAVALVAALSIGFGVSALAVSVCKYLCTADYCTYICQSNDSSCYDYYTLCLNGQGYCRMHCTNGNVYYTQCIKYCPDGGGSSPIFRKTQARPEQAL
jgi:hypothetical protein